MPLRMPGILVGMSVLLIGMILLSAQSSFTIKGGAFAGTAARRIVLNPSGSDATWVETKVQQE